MTCINSTTSKNKKVKTGSVVLELAITMPIFCVTAMIILVAVNCIRADIALTHAVDQVSGEIAFIIPAIDAGIDFTEVALDFLPAEEMESIFGDGDSDSSSHAVVDALAFSSVLSDRMGISLTDMVMTAVFGRAVRDRIDEVFYDISQTRVIYSHIDNLFVYLDFDREHHVLWIYVHYEQVTPFNRYEKMLIGAAPVYGDLSLGFLRDNNQEQSDTIWQEDNFTRGRYFRTHFGANLPQNYPVIARWDNGTATSIKSIDLTAPTYENDSAIERKVMSHIDDLASFYGTTNPWGSQQIHITEDQIQTRILIVVIPENSPHDSLACINNLQSYAQSKGIILRIERHEQSHRYVEPQSEED